MRVHAGTDPVTGKRHRLTETIPAGPNAAREAEKARTRLLNQVDEKRNPRTNATVNQLMDRYLELSKVDELTIAGYESAVCNQIRPLLGHLAVGRVDGEVLDSFYKQLATSRAHCGGRSYVEHRTDGEHPCDGRCRHHKCRPLADSSLRKIQAILTSAGKRAVRWGWVGVNPFELAEPIATTRPDPQPPAPEQAAAIAAEAWQDLDWGMLAWLAMVTGARRRELCALKWGRLDSETRVLTIRSSIAQQGRKAGRKAPRRTSNGASRSTSRPSRSCRSTAGTAPSGCGFERSDRQRRVGFCSAASHLGESDRAVRSLSRHGAAGHRRASRRRADFVSRGRRAVVAGPAKDDSASAEVVNLDTKRSTR